MKIDKSNKIAILEYTKTITYDFLLKYINNYINFFEKLEQNRIVILVENRFEWLAVFIALLKLNKVAIPVDIYSSENDLKYIISNSESDFLIYSSKTEEKIKSIDINKIKLESIFLIEENSKSICINKSEELATIIYTSGTSSFPLGVKLSFNSILLNIESLNAKGRAHEANDKVIVPLPFYHAYPLLGALQLLDINGTIVILKELNSDSIKNSFIIHKPTSIITVPLILEKLHKELMKSINNNKYGKILFSLSKFIPIMFIRKILFRKVHEFFGGNLRIIPCGGAHLKEDIQKDFKILGIKVAPGYGLTEAGPIVTLEVNKPIIGASGRVTKNLDVKIENGEILIKGPQVMLGYQNNEELNKERLKENWFYTGDLGYLKKDYLFITGRKKELIVLANGKNIWPAEIEDIINEFDIVKECALLENDGKVTLLVLPIDNFEGIEDKVKKVINDKYNSKALSHKVINDIKIIKSDIPRTRLGKIQRYKLKDII